MTNPDSQNEREARKQYLHDRQKIVLTAACVLLVVALIIAIPFYTGLISTGSASSASDTSTGPNYGVTAVCAPEGATGVSTSDITVRVLNGTNSAGLATAVGEELENRGFVLQSVGDYDSSSVLARTEIRFGSNAIAKAYTVASHFSDAVLRMDDREDQLIDVIIGSSFYDLKDSDKVKITAGTAITSIKGCVAADKMTKIPAAIDHTAA